MTRSVAEIIGVDFVVCPLCDKTFKSLISHIVIFHKRTTEEIRKAFPNINFVCDKVKTKISSSGKGKHTGPRSPLSEQRKKNISIQTAGKNNPFYGKKHSDETRLLMKNKQLAMSQATSERLKKDWERRRADSVNYIKYCEKLSLAMTERMTSEPIEYKRLGHLTGWIFSEKFEKSFYYRSSYEKEFIEFCEKEEMIKSLSSCWFTIDYINSKKKKSKYLPDFIVNEFLIVEIKPLDLKYKGENWIKAIAAQDFCNSSLTNKYVIYTEKDIFDEYAMYLAIKEDLHV